MNNAYYWVMSVIVVVLLAVFLTVVGIRLCHDREEVTQVRIELVAPAAGEDASRLEGMNARELARLDSVIAHQEQELNEQYELFMKARKEDADLVKILSCVGAFVLAMFSLFGIKKFSDIHDACRKEAERVAEDAAGKKAQAIAETTIRTEVATRFREEYANGTVAATIKEEVKRNIIVESVTPLEDKVNNNWERIGNHEERIAALESGGDSGGQAEAAAGQRDGDGDNAGGEEDSPEINSPMPPEDDLLLV